MRNSVGNKSPYEISDFFVGRVSPFLFFEMEYHSLFDLVESHKDDKFFKQTNPATEVSVIGLVARFEAFCKHQFAAIVNIFPDLLGSFTSKRGQPSVQYSTVISLHGEFEKNVGFVLAEQYDFGTAESINGLFRDLLLVTPFSSKEIKTFNEILFKRNLLVHHAGFYTLQYLKENSIPDEIKKKVFREAIVIDTNDYHQISDFLFEMAMKITRETVKALKEKMESNPSVDSHRLEATNQLLKAVYDTLE